MSQLPFDQRLGQHVHRTQGYFVIRNRGANSRYGQHSNQKSGLKMPRTEEELYRANDLHDEAEVVLLLDGYIIGVVKHLEGTEVAALGFKFDEAIQVMRVPDFYKKFGNKAGMALAAFHRTKKSKSPMSIEVEGEPIVYGPDNRR